MLYVYYVMSKIDMLNQEEDKEYNNRVRFENKYRELQAWWIREHMPITKCSNYVI